MNQFEMKQLAYQSNLKNRALQVLLYLIDRANKEQTCFPAMPTIGRELHISISTVKRAMRELVEAGYVKKESRFREGNRGQTSNLYTLYFPEEHAQEKETVRRRYGQPKMKQLEQTSAESVCMVENTDCKCEGQEADKTESICVISTFENRNQPKNSSKNTHKLVEWIKHYIRRKGGGKIGDFVTQVRMESRVILIGKIRLLLRKSRKMVVYIFQWTGEEVKLIPP